MLTVYLSNRAELLAQVLANQMRLSPPKPFEKIEIMVNTWPTSRWLSEQIASINGISAQVEFPFPSTHLKKFIQLYLGKEVATDDPWKPSSLIWSILELLPSLLKNENSKYLVNFLEDKSITKEVINKKQWDLAKSVANTFSDYFLYRPRLIEEWWHLDIKSNKKMAGLPAQIRWQPILLNQLKELIRTEPLSIETLRVIERLKQKQASINKLPDNLQIFGVSTLPPIQIELIQALSSIVNIEIFLLTPCKDLWQRCRKRRHEFASSWKEPHDGIWLLEAPRLEAILGRMGAEFQQLLEGSGEYQLGELKEEDFFLKSATIKQRATLLERLQESFIETHAKNTLKRSPDDSSILFFGCPGKRREVQLVRDQIIQLLAKDKSLQARDIIIMTPQIERFAPLIASSFNDTLATNVNLPWKITDRSQIKKPGLIKFMLDLLEISSKRLTFTRLDELLGNKLIQAQFKFNQDEIDKMLDCLNNTSFRWGVDSIDRNGEDTHSLKWCLERWLLGIILPSKPGLVAEGIAPYSSNYTVEEISKWWALLEKISNHLQSLRTSQKCDEWVSLLKTVVSDLFEKGGDWTWERDSFISHLDDWQTLAKGCQLNIDTYVVKEILTESLSLETGRFGHRSGKITISALEPMRAIPHKVVILMGLDESLFPRKQERPSFNLLEDERFLGDPKSSDKDRYVLLEALLSCRQHLLITWNSRDEKTGESQEPPAPIQQWIDTLKNELDENSLKGLVNTLPANPLDYKNFLSDDNRTPFSCDKRNLEARRLLEHLSKPKSLALIMPITWNVNYKRMNDSINNDLIIRWLKNPQEIWLEQLNLNPKNIHLKDPDTDTDTMKLDELQRSTLLKERFTTKIEAFLSNPQKTISSFENWDELLKGQGILPAKAVGLIECEVLEKRWNSLFSVLKSMGELHFGKISINKESIKVLLNDHHSLLIDIGKLKSKTIMKAWLKHLQLCSHETKARNTIVISRSSSKTNQDNYEITAEMKHIPQDKAQYFLDELYSIVEQGLDVCWPIPAKSGWEFSKAKLLNKKNYLENFKQTWHGNLRVLGERDQSEMISCFGNKCEAEVIINSNIFEDCMKKLYHPIIDNIIKLK